MLNNVDPYQTPDPDLHFLLPLTYRKKIISVAGWGRGVGTFAKPPPDLTNLCLASHKKTFANSVDPDQTLRNDDAMCSGASDQDLHCLH